ncbi:hypothetical protein ACQEVB_00360 [Pseudonocardia sp. CA-107938]|uniref:hypothetical protein n=1 Tax=Pseudonocardia sp. CA-107938 TaxID=3240021 RepID=UPI003D922DBE
MKCGDELDEPVLAPRHRTFLRAESLPRHLPVAAVRLHRQVRRRLHELDLAAEHGRDRWTAQELRRAASSLRELLAMHMPFHGTHCPTCRSRWGLPSRWPCHVWQVVHHLLDGTRAA